jgi:hypothetical protein
MAATIDLGRVREVSRVGVDCLRAQGAWIFLPGRVEAAVSLDGETWNRVRGVDVPLQNQPELASVRVDVDLSGPEGPVPCRFLRVRARNLGPLPDWHPGSPEQAWLFVDEIVVQGP